MTNHSFCGITTSAGRDCTVPVPDGSPFNVCGKHMAKIADYLREADAIAGMSYRLGAPCPGCRLTSTLIADVHTRTATCESCGHTISGNDPANIEAEFIDRRPRTRLTPDVVYYVRFGDRVKIGTTRDLRSRLGQLPHDEVLAVEIGGRTLEHQRHVQFRDLRLTDRGEWFRYEEPLRSHIASLRTEWATVS